MRAFILTLISTAFLAVALPPVSYAQEVEQDRALELRKKSDLIPYGEIARRAVNRFGGRVVGQKLREQGGRPVYELRLLKPDGKVLIVIMDAKTGRVIRTRGR